MCVQMHGRGKMLLGALLCRQDIIRRQVRNDFHRLVNMYNDREILLSSFHLNEQTLESHPDSNHLMSVAKQPTYSLESTAHWLFI